MESQVDVLEGKRRALDRYRDALAAYVEALTAFGDVPLAQRSAKTTPKLVADTSGVPPAVSRLLLGAQEDLRREIARAMHDGPAQSLTNIVLQAQIVERLVATDPAGAGGEVRQLVAMVQQTLEATKSFIFDVRPMVLDDLGLVPTLRRAARERGQRAGVPVEFDSLGPDRRLPMDLESGLFRIIDEAMAAYLSARADRVSVRLDWSEEVEARVSASRATAETRPDPTPDETTGRGPAAGPRRDDGRPARRCARRGRGRQARRDRRPAAIDLARDPEPRSDPRDVRRAVSRWRRAAPGRRDAPGARPAVQGLGRDGPSWTSRPGPRRVRPDPGPDERVHGAHPGRLRRDPRGHPQPDRERHRRGDRRLRRTKVTVVRPRTIRPVSILVTPPYIGAALGSEGEGIIQEAATWRSFTSFLASLRSDEEGQGLAEYALILALIAIVAIIALIFLGGQVSTILSTVGDSV